MQGRQLLEREFNNIIAMGTDRRLGEEVSMWFDSCQHLNLERPFRTIVGSLIPQECNLRFKVGVGKRIQIFVLVLTIADQLIIMTKQTMENLMYMYLNTFRSVFHKRKIDADMIDYSRQVYFL